MALAAQANASVETTRYAWALADAVIVAVAPEPPAQWAPSHRQASREVPKPRGRPEISIEHRVLSAPILLEDPTIEIEHAIVLRVDISSEVIS